VANKYTVKSQLHEHGLLAESFNGSLLFEPCTILNQHGRPFRIFTAFWRACLAKPTPPPSLGGWTRNV
jgi:deoxyribodipyrimidine photo-lyase